MMRTTHDRNTHAAYRACSVTCACAHTHHNNHTNGEQDHSSHSGTTCMHARSSDRCMHVIMLVAMAPTSSTPWLSSHREATHSWALCSEPIQLCCWRDTGRAKHAPLQHFRDLPRLQPGYLGNRAKCGPRGPQKSSKVCLRLQHDALHPQSLSLTRECLPAQHCAPHVLKLPGGTEHLTVPLLLRSRWHLLALLWRPCLLADCSPCSVLHRAQWDQHLPWGISGERPSLGLARLHCRNWWQYDP